MARKIVPRRRFRRIFAPFVATSYASAGGRLGEARAPIERYPRYWVVVSASATLRDTPQPAADARPPIPRWAWKRLAACTAAAALLQLDGTLITVALPSVAHGLSVKGSSTSAVLSAYFAAYALLLIPGGELVDRFGARRLALTGLALFAIGRFSRWGRQRALSETGGAS